MNVPESHRDTTHPVLGSDRSYGNNGLFSIPHYKINDYMFVCLVSDGQGWDHVSVSLQKINLKNKTRKDIYGDKVNPGGVHLHQKTVQLASPVLRCPTWEEMCFIKDLFWKKEECVIQFHPPEREYISNHHYCLHLWKPQGVEIVTPPSALVGIKTDSK